MSRSYCLVTFLPLDIGRHWRIVHFINWSWFRRSPLTFLMKRAILVAQINQVSMISCSHECDDCVLVWFHHYYTTSLLHIYYAPLLLGLITVLVCVAHVFMTISWWWFHSLTHDKLINVLWMIWASFIKLDICLIIIWHERIWQLYTHITFIIKRGRRVQIFYSAAIKVSLSDYFHHILSCWFQVNWSFHNNARK